MSFTPQKSIQFYQNFHYIIDVLNAKKSFDNKLLTSYTHVYCEG